MSNVAPEHGPMPFGPNRTGPGLWTGGSRPPAPSTDSYGTVSEEGPTSMNPLSTDPDSEGAGDLDY